MRIAGRLWRVEQTTRKRNQAALHAWLDDWLQSMLRADLLAMHAFLEALFDGEEEKAVAMLSAEDPPWLPNLVKWIEWASKMQEVR